MIAKIAVDAANFAIDKSYSYRIPFGVQVKAGMRVQVPFGRGNRRTEGVVVSVEEGDGDDLKPVERCLDETPVLSPNMLKMAAFIRDRYFCTFYEAAKTMLPAGLWFHTKERFALTEDRTWENATIRKPYALQLLQMLCDCGGEADAAVLRESVGDDDAYEAAISYLLHKKWIFTEVEYLRRLGDKTEKIATLAVPAEEAMAYAAGRPKSAIMQKNILELLCTVGSAAVKDLCYFTGGKPATVKRLAELGYIELSERPVLRCREIRPAQIDGPLILNAQQQAVYSGLLDKMCHEKPGCALLYGVTGSGKTSVYIRLIQKCLEDGKQSILLVPEIALTPQLLGLLSGYFGENVAVLHSSLPATERYDQWKRIRSGEAKVVVGTRSAVFAPCPNLGLIVIDEEQEHSYKSENSPRYDAREVAQWRGVKENALVLFGSATPSIQTMYYAKSGRYSLFTLKQRFNGRALPKVEIVDMRKELSMGNECSISYPLQDAIGDTRNAGKQTILFLNRRGNSRALFCIDCRESPECPRCSAKLTYHSANERLMCHYCGHSETVSDRCPRCNGPMKRVGVGTQKVQEELQYLFSDMKIQRMDADTVSAANTHEMILDKFKQEGIPLLLGTQMVAKGLNLPNVTLVGVLDADMSLYTDSYRAAENTFNMLTQVVGRAGRGDAPGMAMIQTMVPEHKVIELAAKQDYDSFYDLEIGLRSMQKNPPFGELVSITFSGRDEAAVLRGAVKFRDSLRACLLAENYAGEECTVFGPAPCPVPKINYHFRYRLTLRCKFTKPLRQLIAHILRQFSLDRVNREVYAFADVNSTD